MPKYALITSDVPEKVLNYLARAKLDFKVYEFNPVLDLSNVDFQKRNNGFSCWRECDNFIEGLAWEDYKIKPRNSEEAQKGSLSSDRGFDRGWTEYRCKAYQGKKRFLKWGLNMEEITDNNPKGIIKGSSWISCNHCEYYNPRTLEGRKHVLVAIKGKYETVLEQINGKINCLKEELKKQSAVLKA